MPAPNPHHFIVQGQTAAVANSLGQPWQGDYVFNSGDLVLDLLHNFFLEVGARTHKIRVYEMTDHPIARQCSATCSCAAACTRSPTPRRSRS
jgi:Mn-containing catalase